MRNTSKRIGFAVIAAIGFAALLMTGCPEPDPGVGEDKDRGTPVSIEITSPPTKTTYNLNDDLALSGMVVTATYSDGTTAAVTGYTTSGYDKTTRGNQTVTVTYRGQTATFTVDVIDPNLPIVATPTASVAAGTYNTAQTVTLTTTTEGAQIYYTTNGTNPTASSALYSGAISIDVTTTLKVVAIKEDYNDSGILTAAYILKVLTPTADTAAGTVNKGTEIELATATEGAEIWYTTNNSAPTKGGAGSVKYTAKIAINTTTTIKAIAVKDGWNNSEILTATYTIPKAATPVASPSAGTYNTEQRVTLASTTTGAAIYYTTNGTTPTASSALYSGAIDIDTTTTLKAVAIKDGWDNSDILTAVYTLTMPIKLTENVWADGNIPQSNDEQWFKFTATANTQYIHVIFDTVSFLMFQAYDANGAAVEIKNTHNNANTLYPAWSNKYLSMNVTEGQVYSIKVWTNNASSGTYQIAFNTSSTVPPITLPSTGVTVLTENTWTDGNLPASSDKQWFKFTATAGTQYIHASFGTLTELYVQVYDSGGAMVGSESYYSYSDTLRYVSRTVTVGQEYYIKVRPYSSSDSGTYNILFNTSSVAPVKLPSNATQLTENVWASDNLSTSNDEQWFKFTATAGTQYIHAGFGTLTQISVQVYDSSGTAVGSESGLSNSTRYVSRTVTVGQEYYIRVRCPWESGTYNILFNASSVDLEKLPSNATQLTDYVWADGNLPTSNDEQWFKFTATAGTQYIYADFGTLTKLYVQVYDSSGATVLSKTILSDNSSSRSVSTVTVGQEYYIRVQPFDSSYNGTYKILFSMYSIQPVTLPDNATTLTLDSWSGTYYSGSDQWFKFTATAIMQYIRVNLLSTVSTVYVIVYKSNGLRIGAEYTDLYTSVNGGAVVYTSRSLDIGQEYYIKVHPYSNTSYNIKFN